MGTATSTYTQLPARPPRQPEPELTMLADQQAPEQDSALSEAPDDKEDLTEVQRPRKRGDCAGGMRPCPWVGCRHHLYLDVRRESGNIKFNYGGDPTEMSETCSLDVAEREGVTLEEVGRLLGLTRERVRQMESRLLVQLRKVADQR